MIRACSALRLVKRGVARVLATWGQVQTSPHHVRSVVIVRSTTRIVKVMQVVAAANAVGRTAFSAAVAALRIRDHGCVLCHPSTSSTQRSRSSRSATRSLVQQV